MVALKTMVNAAVNGYQGHPIRNVRTGRIICFQHGVCARTHLTDPYIRCGRGSGKQITYCINSLMLAATVRVQQHASLSPPFNAHMGVLVLLQLQNHQVKTQGNLVCSNVWYVYNNIPKIILSITLVETHTRMPHITYDANRSINFRGDSVWTSGLFECLISL